MATTESYDSYEVAVPVTVGDQESTYHFSIPKICMNIALADVETRAMPVAAPEPPAPPECSISATPAEVAVGRPVEIDVQSPAGTPITVTVESPGGVALEQLEEPFPRTTSFDSPGTYRIRASGIDANGELVECATTTVVVVDQARWIVRPFVVGFFPSDQRVDDVQATMSPPDDPARVIYHSDGGIGIGVEYLVNDRIGVDGRAVMSRPAAVLNVGPELDHDDLYLSSLTVGPNFHFGNSQRADWFAGPYIGFARLKDATLATPSASFSTDFDTEFVYGAQAGVDVAFREGSAWSFHGGLMKTFAEFEDDDTGLELDLDPWQVLLGVARKF
jgi:outer membrane protein W